MSDEIVKLADFNRDGWLSGQARCMSCSHEWVAVAKAGTVWVECPNCRAVKGYLMFACQPEDGAEIWHCRCGAEVLYATPKALRCCNCGTVQRPFDEHG